MTTYKELIIKFIFKIVICLFLLSIIIYAIYKKHSLSKIKQFIDAMPSANDLWNVFTGSHRMINVGDIK
jgi:cell shape-determining protein MreC